MFRTLMEHIFPLSAGNLLVDTEIPRREGRREPCRTGDYPWGASRRSRPGGWCGGAVGWRSRRRDGRGGRCRGGREVGRLLGPWRRHGPWGGRRWAWSATSCLWRRRRSPPRTDTPPPVPGCSGSSPDWAASASAISRASRPLESAIWITTQDKRKGKSYLNNWIQIGSDFLFEIINIIKYSVYFFYVLKIFNKYR